MAEWGRGGEQRAVLGGTELNCMDTMYRLFILHVSIYFIKDAGGGRGGGSLGSDHGKRA